MIKITNFIILLLELISTFYYFKSKSDYRVHCCHGVARFVQVILVYQSVAYQIIFTIGLCRGSDN